METVSPANTYSANRTDATDVNLGWGVSDIEYSMLVRSIYGIIAVLGITGNFVVCLVLIRVPSLRSNTSNFLIHLSLVDLVVCIWAIPFHLFPHEAEPNPNVGGEIKCRLYTSKFPLWTTAQVSICSLVTVNLERFIAIVYPIKYKNIYTARNTAIMIASCWLIAIVSNSYTFYAYGNNDAGHCVLLGWPFRGFQIILGLYNFVAYYLAPFIFMVVTQTIVIKTLKAQAKTLEERNKQTASTARKSQYHKMWQVYAAQELERTLLVVSVTYAVCWAPNQFLFLVFNLSRDPSIVDFGSAYYHFTVILAVANSCLNPIIYTLKNRPFRRGIRKVFGCISVPFKKGLPSDATMTRSENVGLGRGIITLDSTHDTSQV